MQVQQLCDFCDGACYALDLDILGLFLQVMVDKLKSRCVAQRR